MEQCDENKWVRRTENQPPGTDENAALAMQVRRPF